jgi:hypothetical protein
MLLVDRSRVLGVAIMLMSGAFVAFGHEAAAQQVPAACFVAPARLSDAQIADFLVSPAAVLADNPNGGLPLSSRVRSLAGSSSAAVQAIIALVPSASMEQRAAIGSGLARAARACARPSPLYAAFIQEQVAGIDAVEVIAAFLAASEEVQTAAVAGGASGGASGGAAAAGLGNAGQAGPFSGGLSGDDAVAQADGAGLFSPTRSSFSVGNTIVVVSPVE